MPTMRDLSAWVRDYGHDPRHMPRLFADEFVWHQLWTAMDVIDDVEMALTAYLQGEFPADSGEQYLRVYGVLQGLFIQQDALFDLIRAIHPTKKICVRDVLRDVREARNAGVGHPTQTRRQGVLSAHGMVQHSISKDGFELLSYPPNEGSAFRHIPLRTLIDRQREETVRILSEVVEDLREQDAAHRARFREVEIMEAFRLNSYAFEKIYEHIRGDFPLGVGHWAVDHLRESLSDFEKRLHQRGLTTDSYDCVKYLHSEIEHPLAELTKFLKGQPSEIMSAKTARVFAEALQSYFRDLEHAAKEIDEEYMSPPPPVIQTAQPSVAEAPVVDVKFAEMSVAPDYLEEAAQVTEDFEHSDWEAFEEGEKDLNGDAI